ncbi:nitrous oxide reductase accessory protein NosL [Sinorhizobium meliloti]|uniref:nitrous oxide reductase accessory protein NosL n=1 Tax=Rhizobium meliloti TaxID=382 RepID=UPI001F21FEB3|nr:nitrous oxide reductase accessory protein NosL [Sinorhizobium meliloti]MCM5690431.1 nitrous oxide reductase accessory protein NosL [Sinorhizobium meliloti]
MRWGAVPFSSERAARDFAAKNGGRVTGFAEIPKGYVLGTGTAEQGAAIETESHGEAQIHG